MREAQTKSIHRLLGEQNRVRSLTPEELAAVAGGDPTPPFPTDPPDDAPPQANQSTGGGDEPIPDAEC